MVDIVVILGPSSQSRAHNKHCLIMSRVQLTWRMLVGVLVWWDFTVVYTLTVHHQPGHNIDQYFER